MKAAAHDPSPARHRWPADSLTLALAPYDRHVPFFDGSVRVEGFPLLALEVAQSGSGRHGGKRHERMLRDAEFDGAEVSLSSYLMARDRGAPLTAIPIFPRRLFSISQMWCRTDAPMRSPGDLAGRRVGINTFQTTLSVLAKADLKRSYNVSWRNISWVVQREETVAFSPPAGVSIERAKEGRTLAQLLTSGEIDAVLMPHPPTEILDDQAFRRLCLDPQAEEERYFHDFGYFPIMHVIAFREEIVRDRPQLAMEMFEAFNRAWEICRRRYDDPNQSWLAWGRQSLEHQRRVMGNSQGWPNGVAANRENLCWFAEQSFDQGLTEKVTALSDLFHESTLDT